MPIAKFGANPIIKATTFKEQFASAWHFLKNTRLDQFTQHQCLADLPWYLVIGPAQAGKTQLITQSQFELIPAPHLNTLPADESEAEHRCNWWFTHKITFIDVPGQYLISEDDKNYWSLFLNTLQPYLERKPLNGIILIIDLTELSILNKTEQKKYSHQLHDLLFVLSKQFATSCPLYLLLNKIDRISGFMEFFADLGYEEREQICGINLINAPKATTSSLPRLFKNQFELLIQRLQGRVIWRLHHERNVTKRALITQFPLQLASFGNYLADILYQLADVIGLAEKIPLQGIYFVSGLQYGLPIDCLRKTPRQQQNLLLAGTIASPMVTTKKQSYFSQQLFHNITAHTATLKSTYQRFSRQDKLRLSAYILALTLITCSGLLMANNFNQRIAKLNAAQTALARYNVLEQQLPLQNPVLGQTLAALNTLRNTKQLIAQTKLSWFSTQARQLAPLADKAYHTNLTTHFLPILSTMLEHALSNGTDPDFTYGALKVYLMLGDPSHLDRAFVKNWFAHYWQQLFIGNLALQQQLNDHLAALLAEPVSPAELNQTIIKEIRTNLATTAAPKLAYAIVKSQVTGELINPISKNTEQTKLFKQVLQSNNLNINSLYTKNLFATVYLQQIITASNTLLRGDWVLDTRHDNLNTSNLSDLVEQVRILYLKDYANQWQYLINNTSLLPWQNWQQMKLSSAAILSRYSPFIQLLKAVNDNTDLTALTAETTGFKQTDLQLINNNLSKQFTALNIYSQSNNLNQTMVAFKNLQTYLQPLAKDGGDNKAAFLAAKARFMNKANTLKDPISQLTLLANNAPVPLHDWFNSIAINSWQLIINSTNQYINSNWQQQVVPFYQVHLANHYPLDKTSTAEVTLANFTNFFGNSGLLMRFFTDYLAPFIDTTQAQWQWRTVGGQTLKLAPTVLPQLERATIINSMFFAKTDEPKVLFTLKAISFEPGITHFSFKLGKENFTDELGSTSAHKLMWPSKGSSQDVTLIFTDNTQQTVATSSKGTWALFRLLDKSNLLPTTDTQHYQLILDNNGNAIRYQLIADKLINPFIAGIIEQFQCPSSLIE